VVKLSLLKRALVERRLDTLLVGLPDGVERFPKKKISGPKYQASVKSPNHNFDVRLIQWVLARTMGHNLLPHLSKRQCGSLARFNLILRGNRKHQNRRIL
jgi:hypothetical protein